MPAGDATAQDRDRDHRAVSRPRSRTRAACARPSCEILFLRSARAGAALRAPRRMPRVAFAARSPGGRMGAADAAPYAKDARTRALRVAEPRRHAAAAPLRRIHLHVGLLSGGRALREGSATAPPYGSNGGATISSRRTRSSRRSQARSDRARLRYVASSPVTHSRIGSSSRHVHVAESFRRDGSAYAKLFYNPYGVDLAMFPLCPEKAPSRSVFASLCRDLVPSKRLRSFGRGSEKGPWGAPHPCRPDWRFGFSDRR